MAKKTNAVAVQATQLTPVEQEIKAFELMEKQADLLSKSTIIPATYQGENNKGNIIIALDLAKRMGANPLMVMQNLDVIYGKPAWSAKFLIATVNTCGRFTSLQYEWKGKALDEMQCRCYAYEKGDTERKRPLYGAWISMSMARDEGWMDKKGSKWKTMPQQMLMYRAAAFWQRTYAPEISMGLLTADEVEDVRDVPFVDVDDVMVETEADAKIKENMAMVDDAMKQH